MNSCGSLEFFCCDGVQRAASTGTSVRAGARAAYVLLAVGLEDVLAQEAEVGLVRGEPEHDQVRVEAVQAVLLVRLPVGLVLHVPDVYLR